MKWSQNEIENMKTLLSEGKTIDEVAFALRRSSFSVAHKMSKEHLKAYKIVFPEEHIRIQDMNMIKVYNSKDELTADEELHRDKLTAIIDSCSDPLLQSIMKMRYYDNLFWFQIGMAMNTSDDVVRKAVKNYLRRIPIEEIM